MLDFCPALRHTKVRDRASQAATGNSFSHSFRFLAFSYWCQDKLQVQFKACYYLEHYVNAVADSKNP